jgi:predicted metalloendopeptidase
MEPPLPHHFLRRDCRALLPALLSAVLTSLLLAASAPPALAQATSGIDSTSPDPAISPRQDFYRHVNAGWMRRTEIPADQTAIDAFSQIHDAIQPQLRGLIEAAAGSSDAQARKIQVLYASFMDEATVNGLGQRPLAAQMAAIDAIASPRALATHFAQAVRYGVRGPLQFGVSVDDRDATRHAAFLSQGGLGLPDRAYYLNASDPRMQAARGAYLAYATRMLALAGVADAPALAQQVLALETALARTHWTRVQLRDPVKLYNPMLRPQLQRLAPAIDWDAFAQAVGTAGREKRLIVGQPSALAGLSKQLQATPLATWKAYAKLRWLGTYGDYMDAETVAARFALRAALGGATENQPRWKRGIELVEWAMGEGLGQLYVAKYFPPESQRRMDQLVANLLAAYGQSLAGLDWMSPATKKEAQAKLATFMPKVGHPKRWRDYGALQVDASDLVGNVQRAHAFEHDRQLAKLGAPIDRDEWGMSPQTVNAYYNASLNEIVFPAAILQPPFFDAQADDAANYGAIGAVIGHEISHGFDDEGSQYDAKGNLRNWWTKADRTRFAAKTKMLVQQYDAFEPLPGYKVNGALTLGENIADNAGLAIAYKAYQIALGGKPAPAIDGLSGDQRFFYGFAQVWRANVREPRMIQLLKTDPHAPDAFRANGSVRNHPAFHGTFGTQPGDAMWLAPARRVSLW